MSFGVKFGQRLDDKDTLILQILRRAGRITNKKLAGLVGISPSACLDRVKRLERSGVICGYSAHIAPNVLEASFEFLANIRVSDLPDQIRERVDRLITSSHDVVAVFEASGAFDCVVHFAAKDVQAWKNFCAQLAAMGIGADRLSFGLIVARPECGDIVGIAAERGIKSASK